MKITFICPPAALTGGTRVISIYAKGLMDRGHEVTVISVPHSKPRLLNRIKTFLLNGHISKLQPSHYDGLNLNHRVMETCRPVTDNDVLDGDIVIATWWETAEWVNALSPSKGCKLYFVQGHEVFDWLPIERCEATYRMPLHKIVISKWLQDIMLEVYGDGDVDLVPNSIDKQQFNAPQRTKQTRPTVGFIYSKAPTKGMDLTLKTISILKQKYTNLRIVAFGAEVPQDVVGWDATIEFTYQPAQHAIKDIYAQSDVWISASKSEGFNLPAMEAMACRTPVVSARTGWPLEAIVSGKNGYLVGLDNLEELTEAVSKILDLNSEEWEMMSENAYKTLDSSSWDNSIGLFESVLKRMLNEKRTLT